MSKRRTLSTIPIIVRNPIMFDVPYTDESSSQWVNDELVMKVLYLYLAVILSPFERTDHTSKGR